MSDKTIKLPCFGIVVELTDEEPHALTPNRWNGGSITSDLQENPDPARPDYDPEDEHKFFDYNNSMDGIESMVLGHACAGIDVESPAYIEGIETAVQACADNV